LSPTAVGICAQTPTAPLYRQKKALLPGKYGKREGKALGSLK
jgi:hypothetical protein